MLLLLLNLLLVHQLLLLRLMVDDLRLDDMLELLHLLLRLERVLHHDLVRLRGGDVLRLQRLLRVVSVDDVAVHLDSVETGTVVREALKGLWFSGVC